MKDRRTLSGSLLETKAVSGAARRRAVASETGPCGNPNLGAAGPISTQPSNYNAHLASCGVLDTLVSPFVYNKGHPCQAGVFGCRQHRSHPTRPPTIAATFTRYTLRTPLLPAQVFAARRIRICVRWQPSSLLNLNLHHRHQRSACVLPSRDLWSASALFLAGIAHPHQWPTSSHGNGSSTTTISSNRDSSTTTKVSRTRGDSLPATMLNTTSNTRITAMTSTASMNSGTMHTTTTRAVAGTKAHNGAMVT